MVQVEAVRLGLEVPFPVNATFSALVLPVDRHGRRVTLDPAFTTLTGITNARVAVDGRGLGAVLADLAAFSGDAPLWSWGKDEINLMAISGYVAGIAPRGSAMPARC